MDEDTKDLEPVHPLLSEEELKLLLSPDQLHRLGFEQAGTKPTQTPFSGEASFYDQVQLLQQQVATLSERVERLEQLIAVMAGAAKGENGRVITIRTPDGEASAASDGPVHAVSSRPELELPATHHAAHDSDEPISPAPTPSRLDTYGKRKRRT